jgi:hypothetical protein
MPAYTREAAEDRTCNHEDRRDERDALDEHEPGLSWRLVIVTTRGAHLGFNTPMPQRQFTSRLWNDDLSEIAGSDCIDLASSLQKVADNAERFVGLVGEAPVDLPLKPDAFCVMRFGGCGDEYNTSFGSIYRAVLYRDWLQDIL